MHKNVGDILFDVFVRSIYNKYRFEVVELFAGNFLLFRKTDLISKSVHLTYSRGFHVESFVSNCNLLFFQSNLAICMLQIYFSITTCFSNGLFEAGAS